MREPSRSAVSAEAEARLLDTSAQQSTVLVEESVAAQDKEPQRRDHEIAPSVNVASPFGAGTLLRKKQRDRLLLVSFRMPQALKEKLEEAAKKHELNQTDLINEAIELNLQRYL